MMMTCQQTLQIHAFQASNFLESRHSGLNGSSCRLLKEKTSCHPLLLVQKSKNPSPCGLVCSALKKNDGHESLDSQASVDQQQPEHLEDNNLSRNEIVEAVTMMPDSETEISQCSHRVTHQGRLLDKLEAVYLHVLASEQWNASLLEQCHGKYSLSATNLIHYMALKCLDIEQLKEEMSGIGLGSLDTINPHVLASLGAIIQILERVEFERMAGEGTTVTENAVNKYLSQQKMETFATEIMKRKASLNHELLLGPSGDCRPHIMVTVGVEAATGSETLVSDLLTRGTTIFRINCAHGNSNIWSEIIRRVKTNSLRLEKPCRILMDLAGPKLRTGKLRNGPCVMKVSPKKDAYGNVTSPARIWLSPKGTGPPPNHLSPDVILCIDGTEFLGKLQSGETVKFKDARGRKMMLKISKKLNVFSGVGFMAECSRTVYIESGTKLSIKGDKDKLSIGYVIDIPPAEQFVRLKVGDLLTLYRNSSDEEDKPNSADIDSRTHMIPCSSGWLFDSVKPGEPIAFDDGKIWGVIKGTSMSEVVVSITHAGPNGTKLGSDKSINIPESDIQFKGLTSKDLMDLDFIAAHADMAGISFVRDTHDIVVLQQELLKRKYKNLGIVLKIETKSGFEKLPLMLLEAMKSQNPLGVMIARGDLAVECGWERLANMQEEILSICSSAHVPVIWATQVLESFLKSGVPTRAEITDVASARRANCVMLNKGKHILKGVTMLDTILRSSRSINTKEKFKPSVLSV